MRTIGTFNDVLTVANEKVDEYGDLEWSSSAASDYDHFDYYENDDMAVELLFLDGGRENVYILYITVCVSFTDLPAGDILGYGFENPLFR